MRFLFQISLHVRQKAQNRRPFFQLALQLRDRRQRLRVHIVQVKNNQRRFLIAILMHVLHKVLVALHELDLHIHLPRRFLDLGQKEKIVHECKISRRPRVLPRRYWLRFRLRILRPIPRTLPPRPVPVASRHCGAIAVVHGRGINSVLVLAVLPALSGPLSALILRTPSAPPSVSSSASGGFSWSCVHSPLKLRWQRDFSRSELENLFWQTLSAKFFGRSHVQLRIRRGLGRTSPARAGVRAQYLRV